MVINMTLDNLIIGKVEEIDLYHSRCPKCGHKNSILDIYYYCPECGESLKWGHLDKIEIEE